MALAATALLAMAARYQIFQDRDYLARDAHSFEEDGVKRPQHNPRLNSIAREIPRGTHLRPQRHPAGHRQLAGVGEPSRAVRSAGRLASTRPARASTAATTPSAHRSNTSWATCARGENFHASNASLVEHDSNRKLQGYDFSELAALVRYRHQPGNPAMARVLARDRSIHLTLDVRLQLRAREILDQHLQKAGNLKGAVVVMEAASGRRAGAGERARSRSARRAQRRRPRPMNCWTARATANIRPAPPSSWSPPSPRCAWTPS